MGRNKTRLLDAIRDPRDLRKLDQSQLPQLCEELRGELLDVVSETGGHLGASLGVVELTVAAHFVLDTPNDKLIWDTGHQAYIHKILTGRRERMRTIRKTGGLSGFLKRCESPYDAFGAGHAGTSISAAVGMREAFHQRGEDHRVCAIIGDSAAASGMAFEAMNHSGDLGRNLIVLLNDNQMSIAPAVGAFKQFLRRRLSGTVYNYLKREVKSVLTALPAPVGDEMMGLGRRVDERIKALVAPAFLFEGLGFDYIGPIDGHDMDALVDALSIAGKVTERPVIVHALTIKGKGYAPAERHPEAMHGVTPFHRNTGEVLKKPASATKRPSYTQVFGDTMLELAGSDPRVCAITAGMPSGTGLVEFRERFPERFYDVGISEPHGVTFAAGLAAEGVRPVVAIYSTFLQRGFDQILHDVALQKLPVTFAMDRAGLVGADGPTHHGSFDLSYLRMIPDLVIMAAADENELRRMLKTGLEIDGPSAVRYPRGEAKGVKLDASIEALPVGKGRGVHGESEAPYVILAVGTMVEAAVEAARRLDKQGIETHVFDARFIKPLDEDAICQLAQSAQALITVEENAVTGGFGSGVLELLARRGIAPGQVELVGMPDEFAGHGTPEALRAELGLDADGIEAVVTRLRGATPLRSTRR
jgi:1-deoxy-D-xylulose-5-phosphate synthase